jgi:hypothetical protein
MHDAEKYNADPGRNAAFEPWLERLTRRIRRERESLAAERARIACVPQFVIAQRRS